jgi:hypothetical protein
MQLPRMQLVPASQASPQTPQLQGSPEMLVQM